MKEEKLLSQTSTYIFGTWPPTYKSFSRVVKETGQFGTPYSREEYEGMSSFERRHRCHLAPWMDIIDFAEDSRLLLHSLHCRTTYPPEARVALDTIKSDLFFQKSGYTTEYNSKCIRMVGEGYGTLVEFDREEAHALTTLGFPRALLTLDVQDVIMDGLLQVVHAIVEANTPSGWERSMVDEYSCHQSHVCRCVRFAIFDT